MGFFKDLGHAVNNTFSNPSKLVGDIASGGITAIGRVLPKAFGGGQSGIFAKSSEVIGGTAIGAGSGIVTGFASGGPLGAIYGGAAGGAAGFGRGVSGVVHNESGKTIAAGSAKWGAASGLAGGFTSRAFSIAAPKAAAIVTTAGQGGTAGTEVAAASVVKTSAFGAFGKGFEALVPFALLKGLQGNSMLPGTSGGATDVTLNSPGPGTPNFSPSNGPSGYPGVPSGLQTVSATTPGDSGAPVIASTNNLLWISVGAVALLLLLMKKKKHG